MTLHPLGPVDQFASPSLTKVEAAGRDLLVVRDGERLSVLDHDCPHKGAPLSDGYLQDGHVVCPWHRAVFRVDDGRYVEPPACNDLRHYPASVEGGILLVEIDEDLTPHPIDRADAALKSGETFAIIGMGAAGVAAAQTLREVGFAGRIVLYTAEDAAPYDRTDLSKSVVTSADDVALRPSGWAADFDIEIRHQTISKVENGAVHPEHGEALNADRIIVATGAAPVVPGDIAPSARVHSLRSLDDALTLYRTLEGEAREVVIVGSGFIGCELAALLAPDHRVTILSPQKIPFAKLLGEEVGLGLRRRLENEGVRFVEGKMSGIDEKDAKVTIETEGGHLDAHHVVLALGVKPNTGILPDRIPRNDDGGVPVTPSLRLPEMPQVFAAGDIAEVPGPFGKVRTEHWRYAQQLGRLAARNALFDRDEPFTSTPVFWTKQTLPGSYAYIGHAEDWDEVVVKGDPATDDRFVAFYLRDDHIHAAFGVGEDDLLSGLERAMNAKGPVPKAGWL